MRNPSSAKSTEQLLVMQSALKEQGRLRALLEKVNQSEFDLKKRVATLECEASASERLATLLKVSFNLLIWIP